MTRDLCGLIELLERWRGLARRRGSSLQELLRDHLRQLVRDRPSDAVADELFALIDEAPGRSGGARFDRNDAYDGRL